MKKKRGIKDSKVLILAIERIKLLFTEMGKMTGKANLGRKVEVGVSTIMRQMHIRVWISFERFVLEI